MSSHSIYLSYTCVESFSWVGESDCWPDLRAPNIIFSLKLKDLANTVFHSSVIRRATNLYKLGSNSTYSWHFTCNCSKIFLPFSICPLVNKSSRLCKATLPSCSTRWQKVGCKSTKNNNRHRKTRCQAQTHNFCTKHVKYVNLDIFLLIWNREALDRMIEKISKIEYEIIIISRHIIHEHTSNSLFFDQKCFWCLWIKGLLSPGPIA